MIAGAATPGGPVIGFSIGAVALKAGGGPPQVIAYVIAWALFAFQRLLLWEIPFMPARFVWFRAAVSLPFPFLAAAIAMAIGKPIDRLQGFLKTRETAINRRIGMTAAQPLRLDLGQ